MGTVWDRLREIIAAAGYVASTSPFNFDMQPDGRLDNAYCLTAERSEKSGYIGTHAEETWTVTIWVASRARTDQFGCYRQLLADLPIIESSIVAEQLAGEPFAVSDEPGPTIDLPTPTGQDFLIGRLVLTLIVED